MAGFVCLALSFFASWIFLIPGGVLLAVACTIPTWRRSYVCGDCGNPVTPQSRLCPTCRIALYIPPARSRVATNVLIAVCVVICLAIGIYILKTITR